MTTLTARTPEDLLAVAPVVLGFQPADSVVMLTFGGPRCFHARVDLPPPQGAAEWTAELVDALLRPALQHGVGRVVFLLYTDVPLAADRICRRLVRGFREAGIEVVDALRADGRRWFPLLRHRRDVPAGGVPYDLSSHPFTAQAVLDGRVLQPSRGELAATLRPVPARVAALLAAREDAPEQPDGCPDRVSALVGRHVAAGTLPDDAEAARLLVAVTSSPVVRDAVWAGIRRDDARCHVAVWTDLLRRAPEDLAPAAAALLAVSAWVAGHGALAWCAVDRALELDPGHGLARLVAGLLEEAVPPPEDPEVLAKGASRP
ncbi:DUF4192 domain-containing protein [Nocardioides sp. GCM10027113]|uniref:DUF4192 domain-containing protein n=1 Tax=unclassified Nocardioides TaxID=2615069 RepID=UPI00360A4706